MAAGKSTVGPLLADALGWTYVDLDAEIERRTGRSVAELFRQVGEPGFRAIEAERTAEFADRERLVLAPGGGWVTTPGRLEAVRDGSLTVWLRASPETIASRIRAAPGSRPLLDTPDPLPQIRSLLRAREPLYRQADLWVTTDHVTPHQVATILEEAVHGPSAVLQSD